MTPVPFWFRIVSIAMAVLPVLRSPMISSRWPRPIGVMASIDLMPVCIGSSTGWRAGDAGGDRLEGQRRGLDDRALVVDRLAQRVDHAADHALADRHPQQLAGGGDRIALFDPGVVAQDHHADRRFLEVERDALDAVLELDHLAGHQARQAVDPRDAVADLEHAADFAAGDFR